MRKIVGTLQEAPSHALRGEGWLDLEQIAMVEVTSEDPGFPIEAAFRPASGPGWRASHGGAQQIRIVFDEPQSLHQIRLQFHEADVERTQEFTLRWSSAAGGPSREIVRQQWNFSPGGGTTEVEDYTVNLDDVAALELRIRPDLSRDCVASLASLRVR